MISNCERVKWMIAPLIAAAIPVVLPCAHIITLTYLWSDKEYRVHRDNCTCSCWDTVFKGNYEDKVAKYKHIYFNATQNTLKIWTLTVTGMIVTYECFKSFFNLLMAGNLRLTMAFLFLVSIHSHYYAAWAHWNYLNDDFYNQWNHQVFYTLTEFINTGLVVMYLDKQKTLEAVPLIIIASIGLLHAVLGSADQFVRHVFMGEGRLDQVIRDIPLMSTDLVHIAIAMYEFQGIATQKGQGLLSFLSRTKHLKVIVLSTLLQLLLAAFCFNGGSS